MAEALYLIRKNLGTGSSLGGKSVINGVHSVLMNDDDGQTDAQRFVTAAGIMNAKFSTNAYADDYFDSSDLLTTASGILGADGNAVIFAPIDTPEV